MASFHIQNGARAIRAQKSTVVTCTNRLSSNSLKYSAQALCPAMAAIPSKAALLARRRPASTGDSNPRLKRFLQPVKLALGGGASTSLAGCHKAKKGPRAKTPNPNDSATNGHAGTCGQDRLSLVPPEILQAEDTQQVTMQTTPYCCSLLLVSAGQHRSRARCP